MTRSKPFVVGSFIFGALALGVLAILAFGGMTLFAHKLRVVVVFSDSIAGLEVGAPVTFRGARIGRVEGMRLHIDVQRQTSWLPVYLDLDLDRIAWAGGSVGGKRADLQAAVDSGLRAQLVSQGLVGGDMSVNLDYRPGTPALRAGKTQDAFEIPTVTSDLQDLKDQLLKLDLPEIGQKTRDVLTSVQHVSDQLGARIGPLADGLQTTLATTTEAVRRLQSDSARALGDIDRLANESRSQIATNGDDLDRVLRRAEEATDGADALVASLNDMTSPRGDLQASLRDLAASAGSLRGLTHDLDDWTRSVGNAAAAKRMMRVRSLALAALIPLLAACLSHREYRHIYSLDRAIDAPAQTGADAARPRLQLERVLIPDYLDTTDILLRVGAHEIHESAAGRFGERLSLGVTHALRADLTSRLPRYTIALAQPAERPAPRILVNVDSFDIWPTGRCVLVADWSILDADRRSLLSADRGTFTTAAVGVSPGDGAIVAVMADAVRQLADRIAMTANASLQIDHDISPGS